MIPWIDTAALTLHFTRCWQYPGKLHVLPLEPVHGAGMASVITYPETIVLKKQSLAVNHSLLLDRYYCDSVQAGAK
jgi:hypothetical protein